MKIPRKCHNHEFPRDQKRKRYGINSDETNVAYGITNTQTKRNALECPINSLIVPDHVPLLLIRGVAR